MKWTLSFIAALSLEAPSRSTSMGTRRSPTATATPPGACTERTSGGGHVTLGEIGNSWGNEAGTNPDVRASWFTIPLTPDGIIFSHGTPASSRFYRLRVQENED